MTYASYSTYVPPAGDQQQDAPQGDLTNYRGVTIRESTGPMTATVRDGEVTTSHGVSGRYDASNLARDMYGEDDWRGTARSKHGSPTTVITQDSLVTLNGVQGQVSSFVRSGDLVEVSPGVFQLPTEGESQQAPEAINDVASMPEGVAGAVDEALAPVPDHAIAPLITAAVNVVSGQGGDMQSLVAKFVAASGVEPAEAQSRAEYIIAAYQGQTDAYLTQRLGIAKEDLPALYEAARANPRQLTAALREQIDGRSMAGWKQIASMFQAKTGPSMTALEKAGYPVRNTGSTPEVFIGGMWASIKGAARAGLI